MRIPHSPIGIARSFGWALLASLASLAIPAPAHGASEPTSVPESLPGADAPASIRLVEPTEPGTPLVVDGTVYAPDGITPVAGVVLFVYQTDATGEYGRVDGAPRLRGWMKTDARGHYEYRTIRPAPYPGRTIPAHTHTQLWGAGYEPQWNRELQFADDSALSAAERTESKAAGRFAWLCEPAPPAAGAPLQCTHNLRLKAKGDVLEPNIRHGFQPRRPSKP